MMEPGEDTWSSEKKGKVKDIKKAMKQALKNFG